MIDTSSWKKFRVGDLFDVSRPSSRSSQNYDEGNMPFVASGNFNNGVTAYLQPKDENDYDEGGCITVSAVDGYAFYQKDRFLGRGGAGSSIMILRNNNLTELNGKYICTLIRKACSDWEYSNMGNKDKLADTIINLPATSDGQPDWQYMENYMKKIMAESEKSIENLKKADDKKRLIDLSSWKKFRVGELFDIESAKGKNQQELLEGNDVPYIAASKENNGFNRMVSIKNHEEWVSKGNCLQFIHIGDAAAGHVNYIPNDFIGMSGKSSCAYNNNLNEYTGLFIASIIAHTNKGKYSFKDSWTGTKVTDTIIKLPATSDGQPDWQYMEDYMKKIMAEAEQVVKDLQTF